MRPWNFLDPLQATPLLLALNIGLSNATPLRSVPELADLNNVTLSERGGTWCSDGTICGYYDQLCCGWDEGCYTNVHTIATCTPRSGPAVTGGSGYWQYYTSTYVETDRITRTTTYSSYVGYAPATSTWQAPPQTTEKEASCSYNQHSCGPICCKSWQYCVVPGQCGQGGAYTAPLRPTSIYSVYPPVTVRRTTTVGFQPAVETGHHRGGGVTISESSTSGSLSGGAIAGIVIGVIAAIIILIILCLILCFGAAWNAVLAFFGLGRRRRRETVEVEEYHRHGSRTEGRQWYGSGGRPDGRPPPPRKKKSSFGWGTVILGLGALWAALGFKRRRDRKRRDEKSEYSASSGYYSDYTASSSSDRRTRDTRRSSRR